MKLYENEMWNKLRWPKTEQLSAALFYISCTLMYLLSQCKKQLRAKREQWISKTTYKKHATCIIQNKRLVKCNLQQSYGQSRKICNGIATDVTCQHGQQL